MTRKIAPLSYERSEKSKIPSTSRVHGQSRIGNKTKLLICDYLRIESRAEPYMRGCKEVSKVKNTCNRAKRDEYGYSHVTRTLKK